MKTIKFYLKKPKPIKKGQKRPRGTHKSFAIFKRLTKDQVHQGDKCIKDPVIDSVNERFLSGDLNFSEAEKALRQFIISLEKKEGIYDKAVFNSDNDKILEQFWKKEYSTRDIVDERTAYCDFRRAIEAIGDKSIQSSSQLILEKEINKKFKGEKQRRIVSRLNQILKFLDRGITLRKQRPEKRRVQYLTEDEFNQVLACIEEEDLKLLAQVCFYTGMRMGEAFGIESNSVHKDTIKVHQQMREDGTLSDTKNGKDRTTFVFSQGIKPLKRWIKIKEECLASRTNITKRFKKACQKAFPGDKSKHCKIHDLRHSYAIHLLSKGVSLSLIAQSLGNSVSVCEKYYTGFILTPESIEYIRNQVQG